MIGIRIWNYEEAVVVNTFDNHNAPEKGVSKLCLLNELDDSLLLVASSENPAHQEVAFICTITFQTGEQFAACYVSDCGSLFLRLGR